MRILFTPADGEKREYHFDPDRTLTAVEAGVVEQLTGMDYRGEFEGRVHTSVNAQRALLFVLEKRTHPTLTFPMFDYPAGAVDIDLDTDDIDRMRAKVTESQANSADKAAALAQLDVAAAEIGAEPGPKDQPAGISPGATAT